MEAQPNQIDQILQKIRALAAKTVENGASEAEALAAANKVNALLEQYNLTLTEALLGRQACETKTINAGRSNFHAVEYTLIAIAEFCDCRTWFSKGSARCYNFFGLPSDVMMAEYLYDHIRRAIDFETEEYKQSLLYQIDYPGAPSRRTRTTTFQKAMATRIAKRLKEMKEARANPTVAGRSIVAAKALKLHKEFEELGLEFRKKSSPSSSIDQFSYMAGQQAGNELNLNRPIENNSSERKYLQ